MRVFITGIDGTLGRRLNERLRKDGHDVSGCDLKHSSDPQIVRADVADYRQISRALQASQPEMVYHLAAEFGRINGEHFYEQVWRTNAIGTKNMLTVQRQLRFPMMFASSSEIYGEMGLPEGETMREDIALERSLHQGNDYAISKWVNELQIRNAWQEWDSPTMIVRLFNAYGPGEWYTPYRSVVCLFAYRALHGIPWEVFPNYKRVFMWVDDLMDTLAAITEHFHPGRIVNVGGREYRSVAELSNLIIKETGCDPSLARMRSKDGWNVVNKRPDITLAENLLGHDPKVTLETGVPIYLSWLRSQYGA